MGLGGSCKPPPPPVLSRVDSFGVHQSSKSKWAVCAPSESTLLFPRVPRVELKKYLFYPYGPEDQNYNNMPIFSYQNYEAY